MKWLRPRRPSPALVVSLIALFVAMGGTGYAALTLPKNSVGTKQLKKSAVTNAKIKKNAVTSPKVKNGSLLAADFKAGQLPAGPQGPAGPAGAPGANGTAVAYAHILGSSNPGSLLDAANSKNVTNVTQPFPGGYCITVTVPAKTAVGSVDFNNTTTAPGDVVNPNFDFASSATVCPAGTNVLAETGSGGAASPSDFWIEFN